MTQLRDSACVFAARAVVAGALRCRALVMQEIELIKTLSPLGIGGLLACVIFVYYRLDFLRERDDHAGEHERQVKREERLLDVIERSAAASERLAVTIENLGKMLEHDARRA